jgi:hypothetical protein
VSGGVGAAHAGTTVPALPFVAIVLCGLRGLCGRSSTGASAPPKVKPESMMLGSIECRLRAREVGSGTCRLGELARPSAESKIAGLDGRRPKRMLRGESWWDLRFSIGDSPERKEEGGEEESSLSEDRADWYGVSDVVTDISSTVDGAGDADNAVDVVDKV